MVSDNESLGTETEAPLKGTTALISRPRQAERAEVSGETTDLISSRMPAPSEEDGYEGGGEEGTGG